MGEGEGCGKLGIFAARAVVFARPRGSALRHEGGASPRTRGVIRGRRKRNDGRLGEVHGRR